jgi:protein tyrosine phosphatase (PTP) superfamily phosphohydrolase (DUF442 family)
MWTELYWIDGLWPGKLALAARPRGGDWLEDEMASWRRAGIDTVLSLLTSEEEQDLDLRREAQEAKAKGIKFGSLPIPDRQVPNSESEVSDVLDRLDADLAAGNNVVIHCRQGIGQHWPGAGVAAGLERPDLRGCGQEPKWRTRKPGPRDGRATPLDRPLRRCFDWSQVKFGSLSGPRGITNDLHHIIDSIQFHGS